MRDYYLLEAFAALGEGRNLSPAEAWQPLERQKNPQGRVLLEGALSKSNLPKEPAGKPS
jgi:hypothetical protein